MKFSGLLLVLSALFLFADAQQIAPKDLVIASGKMPNLTTDKSNHIHIVYSSGDSIMYVSSTDGVSFSAPAFVAVLPGLFASAMRGPQISAAGNGLVITACTHDGNIFSYKEEATAKWSKARRVNEVDGEAKEALMALSSDGLTTCAVWLAAKTTGGQNLFGARSVDGGKSWSKNYLVYASPDSTICECCKPAVAVQGNIIYVMFRNWLNGNRDMYLTRSGDAGKSFSPARKLGNGHWKLNGCPMDGGGLVINKKGAYATVWRREGKIYASSPDQPENEIGEGRGCSIGLVNNTNAYTWSEQGNVVVLAPNGRKIIAGKGSQPLIKQVNTNQVICVWENESMVHASVITL